MSTADFVAGTPNQHGYIERLASERGFSTPIAACMQVLGRDVCALLATPPDTLEARKVIEALEAMPKKAAGEKLRRVPGASPYTTAKQLRDYATGKKAPPLELDEHARWCLDRLLMHEQIRAILTGEQPRARPATPPQGVNGQGPITMQHLLDHFKTWDRVADAFKVTVPTAKAWGALVPENRVYEAEVKTNGYVRVPRNRVGEVA
jgi:hypothetical protein